MNLVALVLLLAAYLAFLRIRLRAPPHRRRAAMAGKAIVLFGMVPLAVLALAGRWPALRLLPPELAALRPLAAGVIPPHPPFAPLLGAIAGGTLIGGAAAALLERRGRRWTLGEVEMLMPRSRRDLAWGVLLSLVAGVTEELFFRLALPLFAAAATGSAWIGCALGIVLFAYAHRYQGRVGIVATGIVGGLLTAIYLATAQLWIAIALHALVDLNALVLRPLLAGRVRLGV